MSFMIPSLQAPIVAAGMLSAITKIHDTWTYTDNVTVPAEWVIKAGDLMVLVDNSYRFSGAVALAYPAGWTMIKSNATSNNRQTLSAKIAAGGEQGSVLGGHAATLSSKILAVFRGNRAFSGGTIAGAGSVGYTDGDPGTLVIPSGAGEAPLLVLAAFGASGTVDPATLTPEADDFIQANSTDVVLAWRAMFSEPVNVAADMGDEGTANIVQGCYVELN